MTQVKKIVTLLENAANVDSQLVSDLANMICKDRNASADKAIGLIKRFIDKEMPEHTIPDVFFDKPLAIFEACFGASKYHNSKNGGSFKQIAILFILDVAKNFPEMIEDYQEIFDVKIPD